MREDADSRQLRHGRDGRTCAGSQYSSGGWPAISLHERAMRLSNGRSVLEIVLLSFDGGAIGLGSGAWRRAP